MRDFGATEKISIAVWLVLFGLIVQSCVVVYKSSDSIVVKNNRRHVEDNDNTESDKSTNTGGNTTTEAVTRSDIKTLETNIQKGLKNTQKSIERDIKEAKDTVPPGGVK